MIYHLVFYSSYFGYSQTPAVRIFTNEMDYPTYQKDWLFDVIEDAEHNLIHSGYSGNPYPAERTFPSLIKTDGSLNSIWSERYTTGNDNSGILDFYGYGSFQAALEYIDPDDNLPYYVAVGYAKVHGNIRLVIIKTKPDGTLMNTFPRIYRNTLGFSDTGYTGSRRGRDIIYRPEGQTGYFYIAGLDNQKPCVYKIKESLDWNTLEKYEPTSSQNFGDLYSLCFEYLSGSRPDGKPMIGTETPNNIWAIGMAYDTLNKKGYDSNIIITRIPIDFMSPDQTVIETSLTPPTPVWNNTGGAGYGPKPPLPAVHANWYSHFKNKAPLCGSKFHNRTSGDMGMCIQQMADGNMVTASMCNIIMWTPTKAPCITAFNSSHGANIPYWTDADMASTIIERNNFPTPGLPINGGYEKEAKHLGHISGFESFIKVRQDYNGKLYFTASNGDTTIAPLSNAGNTNLSSFFVLKTEPNLTEIWHKGYAGNDDNQETCGFGSVVCLNNELVVNGDNKNQYDNYDMIRLSNDCEQTCTTYNEFATSPTSLDFVTISTSDKLGGMPGTWTITSNKELKGRLLIESGYTVVVDNATLEFANMDNLVDRAVDNGFRFGIEVEPGGKLILQNHAILTSLDQCKSFWRGVHLQASTSPDQTNASTIGILEMIDSRIENAVCGVTAEGGGLITSTNTANLNHVNFLNNRKGVAFLPFSVNNKSRFNFTNFSFESTASVNDFNGIGLNTHCSMFGVNKIIFNGCSFSNTYRGPYRIGIGLASFDATYQVVRGNDQLDNSSQPCTVPNGRKSLFQNLIYGVLDNGTTITTPTGPTNFIGVGEAEFKNCGKAWQCDNANSPLAYKNYFFWDDGLGLYDMPVEFGNSGFGLELNETINSKIHENTFEVDQAYTHGRAIRILNNSSTDFPSLVRKNTFTHLNPSSTSSALDGVENYGDNDEFKLKCNTFVDLTVFDWNITGSMGNQGSSTNSFGNEFSYPNPIVNNINSSATFDYFHHRDPDNIPDIDRSSTVTIPTFTIYPSAEPCNPLDLCDVYNQGLLNAVVVFDFDFVEAPAMEIKDEIWNKIKHKDYMGAAQLNETMENGEYKTLFNTIIPILQSNRLLKPTREEVKILTEIAKGQSQASLDAFHFLSFFMEIPVYVIRGEPKENKASKANISVKETVPKNINHQWFNLYPNPTKGLLYIELAANSQPCILEILDVTGKLVYSYTDIKPGEKQVINLKSQALGVYMYKLYSVEGYFKTGKIIVSH